RYRDDAEATLDAPLATEKPTTLVFAPEFLALLVHESCGHPTEADRLLEHEVAFAGTTFMWPEDRGKLRYGSSHVSMTDDAPASYSLATKRQTFHFSTQPARVIRNGQLDGYVPGLPFQPLTPDFWGRCDLVADDWELHGFLSCAKGEPLQLMRVGHGAAYARFRDVPIEVRE